MSAITTPAPTTPVPTTPPGPFFVWIGRTSYSNWRAGYPSVLSAREALIGILDGQRLNPGLTVTIATFDGRVAWQRTLTEDFTWAVTS